MALCSSYGCTNDYVPDNSCQCNDACELYNDCCTDYVSFCVNSLCSNYGCINDYVPTNACQCNDACELYNDCCSDYITYCINGEQAPHGNTQISEYAQNSITYSVILMAIMFTLMVNTVIQYILLLRKHSNGKQTKQKSITSTSDDRMVILATFVSITFYFLCVTCYLLASIALTKANIDTKTDWVEIKINAERASMLFWSFGYGLMQIVLGGRLLFTFKNTIYAYPAWVYVILCVIYLVEMAVMVVFHVELERFDNPLLFALTVIALICHVVFLLLVMALYVRNLFKIALSRSAANLLQDEKSSHLEENERTKLLMDHTTRMTVLTGIAGVTTIASFVIWCIFYAEEDELQGGSGITFGFLNAAWWMLPMDALVNAICLFLNLPFVFAYDVYSKLCCCCHKVCGSICICIASSIGEKEPGVVSMEEEQVKSDDNDERVNMNVNSDTEHP